MTSAAGHTFDPITHRCIVPSSAKNGNPCDRHELDLLPYADDAFLDQEGIAHVGKLYQREIEELKALKAKWDARYDAGFNRAAPPPVQALDAALEAEMQAANEPDPYCFWGGGLKASGWIVERLTALSKKD